MPLALRLLQGLIAQDRTFPAGSSHSQLHGKHRQTHNHQKDQIQQHKQAAAILPHHKGEPPDIADADGAASADQQKAQPGLK